MEPTRKNTLTIPEAAARLREEGLPLGEHALRTFVRRGEIPSIKLGRKYLLYYPNILRFIERGN